MLGSVRFLWIVKVHMLHIYTHMDWICMPRWSNSTWHRQSGFLDLCFEFCLFKVPAWWGWEPPCSTCMCEAWSQNSCELDLALLRFKKRTPLDRRGFFPRLGMTSWWPLLHFFTHVLVTNKPRTDWYLVRQVFHCGRILVQEGWACFLLLADSQLQLDHNE